LFAAAGGVEGWLSAVEQLLLCGLAMVTPGPILELGCFKGKSTTCQLLGRRWAGAAQAHVVVDLFQDHVDYGPGDFEAEFRANVRPNLGQTDLRVLRQSTFEAEPALRELTQEIGEFQGIFVDADHSRAAVLKDAALAARLVTPGGWVAFHDAMRWEGVSQVLPACLATPGLAGFGFAGHYSSILVLQKPVQGGEPTPWARAPAVRRYVAWSHTPFPTILGWTYRGLMRSPLHGVFVKLIRLGQRGAASRH
jgi:SAM-dependent methyltransferase